MRIKELHLINFGKFSNKKIVLDEKLNIIYGENEAGKSTLFQFIVGMFYGFYKPYVKKRKYLDVHEALKPWNGAGYKGSILIYDDLSNRDLRIERDFTKGQEEVKVFVEETGQEITYEYDIHQVYRLPDVAAKHLGISYATFINTLGIEQLGQETNEYLDKELKNSVVNALSTHTMDVSINKVQDKIRQKLNGIGSERRKTSNFYISKEKLKELDKEHQESYDLHKEIMNGKDESKQISEDSENLRKKLNTIKLIEEYRVIHSQELLVNKANETQGLIKELVKKQKDLKITHEFNLEQIEVAIEDKTEIGFVKGQVDKNEIEIISVKSEISQLTEDLKKPDISITDQDLDLLTKEIFKCNELNDEQNELTRENNSIKVEEENIQNKLNELIELKILLSKKKMFSLGIGLIGIILAALSFILVESSPIEVVGVILGLVIVLVGLFIFLISYQKIHSSNHDYNQLVNDIKSSKVLYKNYEVKIKKNQNLISKSLNHYHVHDIPSLISLKDKWLKEIMAQASNSKIYNNQIAQVNKLKLKKDGLENNKRLLEENIEKLEARVRPITSYYHISRIDELKQVKQRFIDHDSLSSQILNEERRLNDLLKDQLVEELYDELSSLQNKFTTKVSSLDDKEKNDESWYLSDQASRLLESKEEILDNINIKSKSLASLSSKLDTITRGHRSLAEIEEDIANEKELFKRIEFDKQVYENIKATIDNITDELQHNFAPKLNESVTEMVAEVTKSKYTDIKINPEMLMRLMDPNTHQMIHAKQLSRGTIDLFYLALRNALASMILENKRLPRVLDESFAHFDDIRLKAILHLLSKNQEQMILFTCQEREVSLAKGIEEVKVIYL